MTNVRNTPSRRQGGTSIVAHVSRCGPKTPPARRGIRPGVWAFAVLLGLLTSILWCLRAPVFDPSYGTAESRDTATWPGERSATTVVRSHRENPLPSASYPAEEPELATGRDATQVGQAFEAPDSPGASPPEDDLVRYAKSLLQTGSAEALLELHRLIREQPEGKAKSQLGDVAAQWVPEGEVLSTVLDVLANETDQEVLRSVKAMLCERVTQQSLEAMGALHDQSDRPAVRERIEAIVRGITDRDAYDTLADIIADRRFPLTDPLTAADDGSMSQIDTPAAVNRLLQRLNEAAPDEHIERLFQVLAAVNQPDARRSIELAAQGMKEIESPIARVAAVCAMRNYLDERTLSLWLTLVTDQSVAVQTAAQQCLVWASTRTLAESGPTSVPDGG